jgi:hypothetical protein
MSIYHVSNFADGMNEVIAPQLLAETQAQLLLDANVISGKIRAVPQGELTEFDSPLDLLHYGNSSRSVVKWYDRYYWSDNEKLTYGGNIENLGVPYPDDLLQFRKEKDPQGFTGKYKYAVTFVNKNGWESAPGKLDEYYVEIELIGEHAILFCPDFPKGIKYAKIYRTMDNGADFFCIGEVEESGGSFIDRMDDITASMQERLNTFEDLPPPANGKFLTEAGGVFFLAVGSNLYFSKLGNPHAWSPLNFIGIGDVITGICAEFQGVLVFTQNSTCRVIGADVPESITKIDIPSQQGCVNYKTISHLANFPVWLSNDGICIWDGSNITIASMRIMNTYKLSVRCAASANDVYYLFCDDGAICYDRRNGGIFYRLSTICDYAWYDGNSDNLYLQDSDGIRIWGRGKAKTYTYISPAIGGNELTYKKFREVIINSEGKFFFNLLVDGRSVCTVVEPRAGLHRLKLPYSTTAESVCLRIEGETGLNELSVIYN